MKYFINLRVAIIDMLFINRVLFFIIDNRLPSTNKMFIIHGLFLINELFIAITIFLHSNLFPRNGLYSNHNLLKINRISDYSNK